MPKRLLAALALACLFSMPASAQQGMASWYGGGEKLNRHTASGERFDRNALSCAHRTIAFGTKVRVTHVRTGRSVVCIVNDRGPAKRTGRIIDLAKGAASKLGIIRAGVARVRIEIVKGARP